jgi:hypothetical protein
MPDGSWELLQRVAASPEFQKSRRLRELLLYLGERSLKDPNCTLHEQEIGVEVLGRRPDYDTSHDTLVRVQVSQLRKKLQEYFAGAGSNEPLLIDIPKGTYLPVFRPRTESPAQISGEPATVEIPCPNRRLLLAIGVVTILALVGWTLALWRWHRPGQRTEDHPNVNALWTQLFGNGLPTNLVVSDVNLIPFQKLLGRSMPLSEYEAREFERLADQSLKEPVRGLAKEVVNRVTTSVADVEVARDFGVLAAEHHLQLKLLSARDMSTPLISTENTVLLGSWRANPWVGLFEDQMNFRTDYQEAPPSVRFVNLSPLPGEEQTYQAEWRRHGYCRVTYLPNPRNTAHVLLISGSDVISTAAGGRFLTSEDSIREVRDRLGLRPGDSFPHFELLLRTQIVNNTVPRFELVAYRPHPK